MAPESEQVTILVVCLGNICRSPTMAAALERELEEWGAADRIVVDSAGTGDWMVGLPPHITMRDAAAESGLELGGTARQITIDDLERADVVLCADRGNLADVRELSSSVERSPEILLWGEVASPDGGELPDPYGGKPDDYRRVAALIADGAPRVAVHLASRV